MTTNNKILVDNIAVEIGEEKNLLETIRKADIDIPTFCYHSELSIYGACRLCMVEVEGRGVVASCSLKSEPGMKIKTNTEEIRQIRKMNLELLLANHKMDCPSCRVSDSCKLRKLASRFGIGEVRFKSTVKNTPQDCSSISLTRDPDKCILCGDCVRFCSEIQGVGAIDFAHRGSEATVTPAYDAPLGETECVNCGQCASVCPTGAIVARKETEVVWKELHSEKKVVAQIAPAVRVGIGEMFGLPSGRTTTGKIVAAMRRIGFDMVFDTSFAADLTVLEEANEFLARKQKGEKLPIFTSCCPGWVKYAEQYHPSLLDNLSSCRSPQQMFGSIAREKLPQMMECENKELSIVSIMPCTAKKFEAKRDEFITDGIADVDHVLTTVELAEMIREAGIDMNNIAPEPMDMPFGFNTGAGLIFGNSGGVSEAVVRYAAGKLGNVKPEAIDPGVLRAEDGIREAKVTIGDIELNLAIVHGLKNAGDLAKKVEAGEANYDIVEVMACPGGCIGGAGQPVPEMFGRKKERTEELYDVDACSELRDADENPFVHKCYEEMLGEPNSEKAHKLLHTHYKSRKRQNEVGIDLIKGANKEKTCVSVCSGTGCFVRGSQKVLQDVLNYVEENNMADAVDVKATFCTENCSKGPTVVIDGEVMTGATSTQVTEKIQKQCSKLDK
jgi:NADH-quinone oxidoreductase subunit G